MQVTETIEHENRTQVFGQFNGKPFELNLYADNIAEIEGEFNPAERVLILSEWANQ